MKQFAMLVVCLAIATSVPVAAATRPNVAPQTPLNFAAGIIRANGHINRGSGFTSVRIGAGKYVIKYPASTFVGCPAMTVSAFGVTAVFGVVYGESCSNGGASFEVHLYRIAGGGVLQDDDWQFVIVST